MHAVSVAPAGPLSRIWHQKSLLILLVSVMITIYLYTHAPSKYRRQISQQIKRPPTPTHRLSCIKMAQPSSTEGIGAIVKRHEFPLALAELHDAQVQFMDKVSGHGYSVSDFFDTCPEKPDCFLEQADVIVDRCRPGDCNCVGRNLLAATESLGSCRVLQVKVDMGRHMEFGGCYNNTLQRYFPTEKRLVAGPYAALHYRQGDLMGKTGGKAFGAVELAAFVEFLCRATELRIILVTEGRPKFPVCPGRIWMANDSTIPETFNIFTYAEAIVVGTSSFARLIAQGTRARRFVIPERAVGYYLWARDVRWTVVGNDATLHHFTSTEDVMLASAQPGSFRMQSYRMSKQNKPAVKEVCDRSWRLLL